MSRPKPSSAHLRLLPKGEAGLPAQLRSAPPGLGTLNDEQLVLLLAEGDTGAFEVLYRRHVGFAVNLAVRIQGHSGDAEDIVHDAFVKASQSAGSLRDKSAFRAWLGSIVVRLVRSRLRRGRLLRVLGLSSAEPLDVDSLLSREAGPEVRAELSQLYAQLASLPADLRIAWALRNVEHHDLESVSELCGCSLATAKRRIARAQASLMEQHALGLVTQAQAAEPAEVEGQVRG